jgi:hypothetical protein
VDAAAGEGSVGVVGVVDEGVVAGTEHSAVLTECFRIAPKGCSGGPGTRAGDGAPFGGAGLVALRAYVPLGVFRSLNPSTTYTICLEGKAPCSQATNVRI